MQVEAFVSIVAFVLHQELVTPLHQKKKKKEAKKKCSKKFFCKQEQSDFVPSFEGLTRGAAEHPAPIFQVEKHCREIREFFILKPYDC